MASGLDANRRLVLNELMSIPNEMVKQPKRDHPVHHAPVERHNEPVIIFVTVCVAQKRRLLASIPAHELLVDAWRQADAWLVGRYIVMPDHIHFFCSPFNREYSLKQWMCFWRNTFTRNWAHKNDKPIWQRDYWDTQLRKQEHYHEKWYYVIRNPVRAGLVSRHQDWPYKGEINSLRW